MTEFDPTLASPETVRHVIQWTLGNPAMQLPAMLLDKLRSECRLPLRTRAEIDAEIVTALLAGKHVHWNGPDRLVTFRDVDVGSIMRLRDERDATTYGPHDEPSAGSPPVPRAVVGATLSEEP